jgi:hypothetical protein
MPRALALYESGLDAIDEGKKREQPQRGEQGKTGEVRPQAFCRAFGNRKSPAGNPG